MLGEHFDIMNMRNKDISYPCKHFLATLIRTDAYMFDRLKFKDGMWSGKIAAIADYWYECICYHQIMPFYSKSIWFTTISICITSCFIKMGSARKANRTKLFNGILLAENCLEKNKKFSKIEE